MSFFGGKKEEPKEPAVTIAKVGGQVDGDFYFYFLWLQWLIT